MTQSDDNRHLTFRMGVGLAVVTCFLIVWTTIVRDDGSGEACFMLIMAAGVGSFATKFEPAGMARTMAGAAVMQATLGLLIATAPSTASVADGPATALLSNGLFSILWLSSAMLFRAAGRSDRKRASAKS